MPITALVVPISGPYTGTWNALPIGTLSDAGYELQFTVQGQEVNETDAFGMTLVEAIYRGGNWRLRIRGLEWRTGLTGVMQMFGLVPGGGQLNPMLNDPITGLINVGDRWSKYVQSLVLTAILGLPPTTPASLTALGAGLAPQQQSSFNMTSKVRELPLELVLLPYHAVIGSLTYSVPFTVT